MPELTPVRAIPPNWRRLEATPPTGLSTARRIADRLQPLGKQRENHKVFILSVGGSDMARYQVVKCVRQEGHTEEEIRLDPKFSRVGLKKARLDSPPESC